MLSKKLEAILSIMWKNMKVLNQGLIGRGIRQLDKNWQAGTWVEGTGDEKLRCQGVWSGKITEAYVMFC